MEHNIPKLSEKQLILELNKLLKANGYIRKGSSKNWHKELSTGFMLRFCVQGSRWEKNDYDVRFGVSVIGVKPCDMTPYGHFHECIRACDIQSTEQIYEDANQFFNDWTDKKIMYDRVKALKGWRERNPGVPELIKRGIPYDQIFDERGFPIKREDPPYMVPMDENGVYEYVLSSAFLME